MTASPLRRITQIHYSWVVVAVVFFSLLAAQAIRSTPGVIIVPLEREFGWDRATISLAVAVSLITFGLGGPLGGSLIDRFGPRLVMLGGELCILAGLAGMLYGLHELWQLFLLWGVLIGVGTGAVGGVLGAVVAQRWFRTHRGVIIGLFGGATSAGQLIFIPPVAELTVDHGWRTGLGLLLIAGAVMLVPVLLFMRDRPEQVGTRMFGIRAGLVPASVRAEDERATPMQRALRSKDFWLLAGSFFVCGYTSTA